MLLLCYWQAFKAWRIKLKSLKHIKHTAKYIVDIVTEIVTIKSLEKHLLSALK